MRRALLAVVALASCDGSRAPLAPAPLAPAPLAPASLAPAPLPPAPLAPSAAIGWITFEGPLYANQTPMHGGPAWHIHASKLPAMIRSSGTIVIPFASERGLSSVPNLAVRFLSADGARVERTVDLLTAAEFDRALANSEADKRAAFAALGATVGARADALNQELDRHGSDLVPFESCAIDPADPYVGWPPCGAEQSIRCGAVNLRYLGGRQTLQTPRGRRTFPAWRKPNVRSSDGSEAAVNECVDASWLDPTTKLVALRIENLCAVPGDWCSIESDWRLVRLDR